MDKHQAKQILALYRPGTTDAADPLVAEALELVKRDPELGAWFEQQCAVSTAIRGKLREIPVPSGLKRQIIIEHTPSAPPIAFPTFLRFLGAAAAAVVVAAVIWAMFKVNDDNNFTHFRTRMASMAQRGYAMTMTATNQAALVEYFRSNNVPVDYVLSKTVQQLPAEGAAVFTFNSRPVEMLCLYDGVDAGGRTNELWIFITPKTFVAGAPRPGKPNFKREGKLMTASWTAGDKLYLLAGAGDEQALMKYLE